MDIHEALKFMPSLAVGTNPETVEVLDADAVYRRPIVIKALNRALSALVKQEERESFKPTNTGGYWSREEPAKLFDEVHQELDFHEIAQRHNRNAGSVVARLVKARQDQTAIREGGVVRLKEDWPLPGTGKATVRAKGHN